MPPEHLFWCWDYMIQQISTKIHKLRQFSTYTNSQLRHNESFLFRSVAVRICVYVYVYGSHIYGRNSRKMKTQHRHIQLELIDTCSDEQRSKISVQPQEMDLFGCVFSLTPSLHTIHPFRFHLQHTGRGGRWDHMEHTHTHTHQQHGRFWRSNRFFLCI